MPSYICDKQILSSEKWLDFKKVVGELSGKNQFSTDIVFPSFVDGLESKKVTALVRDNPVPSQTLDISEGKMGTEKRAAVFSKDVDTLILTFFDLKELELRNAFLQWQNEIFTDGGLIQRYPIEYQTEISFKSYDKLLYRMLKAFPLNVGEAQFSHESRSEILTFSVTFKLAKLELI